MNASDRQMTLSAEQAFSQASALSLKYDSYFAVYDELFSQYRGKPVTFIEVGILDGGSLFMWREFFGPEARIVGIDLNPATKKWEASGFEIIIGDQADASFWQSVRETIGPVDILLDDGGHTFRQQIATVEGILPVIRNGGLIVVEDTHTSYMSEFGGPSRRSFASYAKALTDRMHYRSPLLSRLDRADAAVHRLSFFESIIAFHIDRTKCAVVPRQVSSRPTSPEELDARMSRSRLIAAAMPLRDFYRAASDWPVIGPLLRFAWRAVQRQVNR